MPSETTSRPSEHFTYHSTHSWSECGNYDDDVSWVTCNACDTIVLDEYSIPEDGEMERHTLGICKRDKAFRVFVWDYMKALRTTYCYCCGEWESAERYCKCPF